MQTQLSYPQRTHIIPVGNQDIERIMQPILDLKPERIYLLTISGEDAFAEKFQTIKSEILKRKIVLKENFFEKRIDYYDLTLFTQLIAEICREEYKTQNQVFFNLSGGTMITVTGTISSIYFGVKPYFARYDYNLKQILPGAIFPEIPNQFFKKPDEKLTHFLFLLQQYLDTEGKSKIKKNTCLTLINTNNLESDLGDIVPNSYNKLSKRYLRPLLEQNYIKFASGNNNEVMLTPEGSFAAKVFGTFYDFH